MTDLRPFPAAGTLRHDQTDWRHIARLVLLSRALDALEERELMPAREMFYQFSARGHELLQVLVASRLTGPRDAVAGYYRSRPALLALGITPVEMLRASLMRGGSYSNGRDIGVVANHPAGRGPCVLPVSGGVGAQFTPAAGWAQALRLLAHRLDDTGAAGSIAVAFGGDGSCAANGFWAALNIATTEQLPMLFVIEDNGLAISVPGHRQTPGGNIADNLRGFGGLALFDGDGSDPPAVARLAAQAVTHVRQGKGVALLHARVPRLNGHSCQDTQSYLSATEMEQAWAADPVRRLQAHLVPATLSLAQWQALEAECTDTVAAALVEARHSPLPDPAGIIRHVFAEPGEPARQGGVPLQGNGASPTRLTADPNDTQPDAGDAASAGRINLVSAIRRTLDHELAHNPRMVVFGEDVGRKGGVHSATLGLQERHGDDRVFDTSLSEEGIIGRALGMALAGLLPVPELQFRKYADPAEEQLNDCGTLRWRTANRFAAPMVVRIAGGFSGCGDPWHSQTGEAKWVHAIGWKLAFPSNAEDAAGLLRSALRSSDPVIFFEHRALLDDAWARRPYPGDHHVVPFGKARTVCHGDEVTIVSWGAMVPRCEAAAREAGISVDLIDLRTLVPWDVDAVLASVRRTSRCLVVHEDNLSAGFGAEIVATLMTRAFFDLDAPVERLTMPDIPSPHAPALLNAVLPTVARIADRLHALRRF